MKKLLLFTLLLISLAINLFADSDENTRQYEEMIDAKEKEAIRNIPKLITQYATTLGCNDYFDPKNVVKFKMNEQIVYIALFNIDTGCSGGTAMSRPIIITLRKSISYPEIYVDARSSAPYQTSNELPQNISKIYVHNNKLWYEAKEFDFKKDALCCPSVSVRGELRFENGMWKGYPISKK